MTGISIFVGDDIGGAAAAGIGQGQTQAIFILIRTGGRIIREVVLCAVAVLPNIIIGIGRPTVYPLIIVCTPAIAHAEAVACRVIGIVNVADGNWHPVARKSHITVGPDKVSGIVVYIACTGTARGGAGVIPVAFQAVGIAEHDGQGRLVGGIIAVIGRIELFEIVSAAVFNSIGCLKHHTVIVSGGIPLPDDIRYIPFVVPRFFAVHKILNNCIACGLI